MGYKNKIRKKLLKYNKNKKKKVNLKLFFFFIPTYKNQYLKIHYVNEKKNFRRR